MVLNEESKDDAQVASRDDDGPSNSEVSVLEQRVKALEEQAKENREKIAKGAITRGQIVAVAAVLVVFGIGAASLQLFSSITVFNLKSDAQSVVEVVSKAGEKATTEVSTLVNKAREDLSETASIEKRRFSSSIQKSVLSALPAGTVIAITRNQERPPSAEQISAQIGLLQDAGFVEMAGQTLSMEGSPWDGSVIPNIGDGRFLMGGRNTTIGSSGEAEMGVAGGAIEEQNPTPAGRWGLGRKGLEPTQVIQLHKASFDGQYMTLVSPSHVHKNNRPKWFGVQFWLKIK